MRKAISVFGLLAALFVTISLATIADQKTATWTGWISDDHCGAKGMSADHKACATTCIKNGSKYVFVNGADKKVIAINNQDAVSDEKILGQEVKVTIHLNDDVSLHVDIIANAKM